MKQKFTYATLATSLATSLASVLTPVVPAASLVALALAASCSHAPAERKLAQDAVQDLDPELGEKLWPNEEQSIQDIAQVVTGFTARRYQEGKRPATRDAHAKGHGCVKARFQIVSDLAEAYRQGAFIPQKEYAAWIRFSNGDGEINPDKGADARGMAIKLLGVEGTKLLPEEQNERTQDFIMINHPVFFVDDPSRYLGVVKAVDGKLLTDKANLLNKAKAISQLSPHEAGNLIATASSKIGNSLEAQYWSMVPYRLGTGAGRLATKFTAKPCTPGTTPAPGLFSNPGDNYLRERLAASLQKQDACFNFYIQRFVDNQKTPIEDSTVEWKESDSPLIHVATITIPKIDDQNPSFDNPAQNQFCENLSFTPWHALPAHKPLGAVNRTRKVVYQANSLKRHELNVAPRSEPTGDEKF